MYKGSIDIARINRTMKLKFNLILRDDENPSLNKKNKNSSKIVNKFMYNGSEYLKLSPKEFITIDISETSDKTDEWNSNTQVNLNKINTFELMKKLKKIIDSFQIKELYFIKNGKLVLDKNISREYNQVIRTGNGKIIGIQHCIINDADNPDLEYEGVVFMINSVDNFCCLTYSELEYLYYELTQLNMHNLSMMLIMTDLLTTQKTSYKGKLEELKIDKVIEEVKPLEVTPRVLPKINTVGEIPDI
jgi:hypothetical protein